MGSWGCGCGNGRNVEQDGRDCGLGKGSRELSKLDSSIGADGKERPRQVEQRVLLPTARLSPHGDCDAGWRERCCVNPVEPAGVGGEAGTWRCGLNARCAGTWVATASRWRSLCACVVGRCERGAGLAGLAAAVGRCARMMQAGGARH